MSTKTYFGTNHIFTSRDGTGTITLSAGQGESLVINGTVSSSSGILKTTGMSDANLGNPIEPFSVATKFYNSNITSLAGQGTSLSCGETLTTHVMIAGCNVLGAQGTGGVSVFLSSGGRWAPTQVLVSGVVTTLSNCGYYSDISEDAGTIAYTDWADVSSVIVYKTVNAGLTYTHYQDYSIVQTIACKISGAYILSSGPFNVITVLYDNLTSFSSQQTLTTTTGTISNFYTIMDIINGDTVAVCSATNCRIWTRVATTWTLIQTISLASITHMCLAGNTLVLSTATDVYVYERPTSAVSEVYTLTNTFAFASTLALTSYDGVIFYLGYVFVNENRVNSYKKQAGVFSQLGASQSIGQSQFPGEVIVSSTITMAVDSFFFFVGFPLLENGFIRPNYIHSNYTNALVTVNSIDTTVADNFTLDAYRGSIYVNDDLFLARALYVDEPIRRTEYLNPTTITPTVPPSTYSYRNNTRHTCQIFITGGTVSAVLINDITTGLTSGTFILTADSHITVNYSVLPSWKWIYMD